MCVCIWLPFYMSFLDYPPVVPCCCPLFIIISLERSPLSFQSSTSPFLKVNLRVNHPDNPQRNHQGNLPDSLHHNHRDNLLVSLHRSPVSSPLRSRADSLHNNLPNNLQVGHHDSQPGNDIV